MVRRRWWICCWIRESPPGAAVVDGAEKKVIFRGDYLELVDDLVLLAVALQLLLAGVKVVAVLRLLNGVLETEIQSQSRTICPLSSQPAGQKP